MAGSVEAGERITRFFRRGVALFKIHSTGFVFGKSKVMILFDVRQPCEKLLKERSPIIDWDENSSIVCSNKLGLVDTRR